MRSLKVAVAALVMQACGSGGQLTPLGTVPTGTTVRLQEANYTIRGATAEDLLTGMRVGGPGENWFAFRWELRYGYQGEEREGVGSAAVYHFPRCGVRDFRIVLDFTRTVPEWDNPPEASEALVADWAAFQDAVRIHGEGHRDIALDAIREIFSRMRTFETEDCSVLRQDVQRVVEGIVDRHQQRSVDYDAETGHGRAQGALWPPRSGEGGA